MATTYWNPLSISAAQVDSITITAVATSGTLSVTINTKTITYTCTALDNATTAATALYNLLLQPTIPAEFAQLTFANPANGVVTFTATNPGTPFTMTSGSAGGATLSQVHTQANVSPSDVGNADNWIRSGSASLPQNGDDVVLANSSVPLLWNLAALAAVQFASLTRYQSFTGQVGLPPINSAGYVEYLPTYFQFTGPGTAIPVVLGVGSGSGPSLERYNVGSQLVNVTVNGGGTIFILGTASANTLFLIGATVGIALWTNEVSTFATITVDGGGVLGLGAGVTIGTSVLVSGGQLISNTVVPALTLTNSGAATITSTGGTYTSVTANTGSSVAWNSNSTITTLTLASSSRFDKSGDGRGMTVTNSTIDGDSCQVNDPNSLITWTNATLVKNQVNSGPFLFGPNRTVKIT